MAQRRSRNRRSLQRKSSNNASGILNDNTAFPDDDDPLWNNRSALRPSNSLIFTKNASSILSPTSTVNVSQLTDKWFNDLTQSDSSKLMENVEPRKSNENIDSTHVDPTTESESEHESQKKRAKFKLNQTKGNKTEKSNIFLKALEQTTDSYTRNLTTAGMINESESTNDESRTIKRLRPRLFQSKKSIKDTENNFDDIFHNSVSEKLPINSENFKLSKENSNHKNRLNLSSEVTKTLQQSSKNVISNSSSIKQSTKLTSPHKAVFESSRIDRSIKKIKDNSVSELPRKELRNRTIMDTSLLSNITSVSTTQTKMHNATHNTNKRTATDKSLNISNSMTEAMQKKRNALFSQEKRGKINTSMFDAVFESDEESNKSARNGTIIPETQTNEDPGEVEEENMQNTLKNNGNSSIFKNKMSESNINRTKSQINEEVENEVFQRKSIGRSSQLLNKSKNLSKSQNKSISNKSFKDSMKKLEDKNNERASNVTINSEQNDENESSSDSEILERSKRVSEIEESIDVESISENSYVENNISKINDEARKSLNQSIKQKSKTSLISKSKRESSTVGDEEFNINEENNETPRSSQRSNLKQFGNGSMENSMKNTTLSSKNKTVEHERTKSSSDEDEGESSTIPKYIRRTKSRLFQKSQTMNENNITNDILRVQNSYENIPNEKYESTSPQKSTNKKANNSMKSNENSAVQHDYSSKHKSTPLKKAQLILTRVSYESSNDSLKENRLSVDKTNKSADKLVGDKTNESTGKSLELTTEKTNESSRNSHESNNKSATKSRSPSGESLVESDNASASGLVEDRSIIKSKNIADDSKSMSKVSHNAKDDVPEKSNESQASSVETSSDAAPELEVTNAKDKSNPPPIAKSIQRSELLNASILSDDLLQTPKPAHSTLKLGSKPPTRITQFFLRASGTNESSVPSPVTGPLPLTKPSVPAAPLAKPSVPTAPLAKTAVIASRASENQKSQEDDEDEEINVTSDPEEPALLSRHPTDIPRECGDTTFEGELPAFLNAKRRKTTNNNVIGDEISKIDWAALKKHTDAMKNDTEERMKREKEEARKRERKKALSDAKMRRYKAQLEAEAKKKKKKPIPEAYYVDGKVYKQPRLPRPKNWATDRLYKHLWRCMEPKFGLSTRIESEEFVKKLSDVANKVERRKKYESYKAEVDELLIAMAKLNIVETRYDFYRFCSEYMPYSFRIKVVPMMLPGNVRNIPFERHLVNTPILDGVENSDSEDEQE